MLVAAYLLLTLSEKTAVRMEKNIFKYLRRYISPVFLALLVASFILWYIAKLNYTYTTELPFQVSVDGERFKVSCVVEGMGTNLFGYRVYMNKRLRVPLTELKYSVVHTEDGQDFVMIDSLSLHNAISVRLSDIKVISVGSVPEIPDPRQVEQQ